MGLDPVFAVLPEDVTHIDFTRAMTACGSLKLFREFHQRELYIFLASSQVNYLAVWCEVRSWV